MLFSRLPAGRNVAVVLVLVILPKTGVDPFFSVNVVAVMVIASIDSLNVITMG